MLIDARYEIIDEDRIEDTDGILITGTEYLHYQDLMRKYYDLLHRISAENAESDAEVESDYCDCDSDSWMDELEGYPPPSKYFSHKSYTNTCGHNN